MILRRSSVAAAIAAFALPLVGCGSDEEVTADAGDDFTVALGEAPVFDGCGSTGDSLRYTWTIVEAPPDMVDDTGKILRQSVDDCAFTLESEMVVADLGTWVIELAVTDGDTTATDQTTVVVAE